MDKEVLIFSLAMGLYLISFIAHSAAVVFNRMNWYKFARTTCFLGAIAASIALVMRWNAAGHPPLSNMYESLVSLATILAWTTLLFTRSAPIPLAEAGGAVLSVLMMGISSLFAKEAKPLIPALQSYWLYLHVSVAFIGEACFAMAFILSYLFCLRRILDVSEPVQQRNLPAATGKERNLCRAVVVGLPGLFLISMIFFVARMHIPQGASSPVSLLLIWVIFPLILCIVLLFALEYLFKGAMGKIADKWLPSAEALDEYTYRAIALGYPLFTVGAIIFGMVWANKTWGRYWGWDPKETWALITFLVYSMYLHVRLTRGWQGTWTALLSLLGFLVTMFTLFGVNLLLAGLHSYASS